MMSQTFFHTIFLSFATIMLLPSDGWIVILHHETFDYNKTVVHGMCFVHDCDSHKSAGLPQYLAQRA